MTKHTDPVSIYDLDGTLIKFPKDYIWTGDTFNWDNFISEMNKTPEIKSVMSQLIRDIESVDIEPIIVTARPKKYLDDTIKTLSKFINKDYDTIKDLIITRPDAMVVAERIELDSLDSDATKTDVMRIIHRHHKEYRESIITGIKRFDIHVVRVYDDQMPNLEAYSSTCNTLYLVDNDTVKLVTI